MSNLILIIIAIATIAFIWLLWLRHVLMQDLNNLKQHSGLLLKDLAKRRDTVPYLLESYRKAQEQEPGSDWHKILSERAEFHDHVPLEKEWDFEKLLLAFIRDAKVKTLNYLEAKKDIEDLTRIIEKEKQEMQKAKERFNERKRAMPYALAAKVFGF